MAFNLDGSEAGSAHFENATEFVIGLEPGTYRLVAKRGDALCRDQTVTVTTDACESVTVGCDVM
jgi:hypothetical protein